MSLPVSRLRTLWFLAHCITDTVSAEQLLEKIDFCIIKSKRDIINISQQVKLLKSPGIGVETAFLVSILDFLENLASILL